MNTYLRWYTVIVLYPDHLASFYGESHMEATKAFSPHEAAEEIQRQVATENDVEDFHEFPVIAVFEGQHEDLK